MFLTPGELKELKRLLAKGVSTSVVAIRFDLSKECVRAIKNDRPYLHLL